MDNTLRGLLSVENLGSKRHSFSYKTREENISKIKNESWDIIVIGGGITGASIARDAVLRGFKVALVEKGDFASGTSSRSTKLVHGGLRYLEQYQFKLVWEACRERRKLWKIAPHLIKPIPHIIPIIKGWTSSYYLLKLGMSLYDLMATFRHVKRHKMIRKQQAMELEPELIRENLVGAGLFYDHKTDDARLTLSNIKSAHQYGACVVNYVGMVDFLKKLGRIVGVTLRDQLSGKSFDSTSRLVINATGAWVDQIRKKDNPNTSQNLRPTKGVHVIVPKSKLKINHCIVMYAKEGGNLVAIPWGQYILIGNTDTDYLGDLDTLYANREDVSFLLDNTNRYFPSAQLSFNDVISSYASVRPLISGEEVSERDTSREHVIFTSKSGLLSIAGGKLTTSQLMAKQIIDKSVKILGHTHDGKLPRKSVIYETPLYGGNVDDLSRMKTEAFQSTQKVFGISFSRKQIDSFIDTYGTAYPILLEYCQNDTELQAVLLDDPPLIKASIIYAIEHEMAIRLGDIMMRRTPLMLFDPDHGRRHLDWIAGEMSKRIGWTSTITSREIAEYLRNIHNMFLFKE